MHAEKETVHTERIKGEREGGRCGGEDLAIIRPCDLGTINSYGPCGGLVSGQIVFR
jgi:hypothetical protein